MLIRNARKAQMKNNIKRLIMFSGIILLFSLVTTLPKIIRGQINHLEDTELLLDNIIKHNKIVLIDFFADWCVPCKNINPVLTQIAYKNQKLLLVKVNTKHYSQLIQQYRIKGLPTLLLFKEGILVKRITGYHTEKEVQRILNEYL